MTALRNWLLNTISLRRSTAALLLACLFLAGSATGGLAMSHLVSGPEPQRSGAVLMERGQVYNCDPGNAVEFQDRCGSVLMICRGGQ